MKLSHSPQFNPDPLIAKIINLAGGKTRLAKHLGVHRQALYYWKRVPAHHVINVEQLIEKQVTRYEMRPDVYPTEAQL